MAEATVPADALAAIQEYRANFDAVYVGGIPRLLNDDGAYLSFVAVLSAIEALAGLYAPREGTGARFRAFVSRYFPSGLSGEGDRLWQFRNAMIHSFNPGPFALVHHMSRLHLSTRHGPPTLNAEDFYAALLRASEAYFAELQTSTQLIENFSVRVNDPGGGAMQVHTVAETRN